MLGRMSTTLQPPPLPGDRVGRYLLGDVLGVGGMATVYKGSTEGGQVVAVKVLHPGMGATEEGQRFRREFQTLQDLRHPGVVRVFEAGQVGSYPWLAMEYVPGTDLGTVIGHWRAEPPLDRFERVEKIFRGLCAALAYVHGQGFIHRDLKPSNVLVTPEGQAKLTDFGVVKAPKGQFTTQLTMVGSLVGTAAFMAPEQITGKPVDGRADLYSLGAVLFMMLTGEKPIVADSIAGYLARHLHEDPPAPSELDPRVPPHLDRISTRLLRKDPAQRYPSARQVLVALDRDDTDETRRLHGRDGVLERIIDRMRALKDGGGGVMVLLGPNGSGRSAVLRALVQRSREAGLGLALGDGVDPRLFDHLCEQLPALGRRADSGTVEEQIAVRLTGRPWTLAVDDLDRADDANLRGLTALTRHLVAIHGEPLLVLVAVASMQGSAGPFCSGASTGLVHEIVPLEGLDDSCVVRLLQDRGVAGAAAAVLGPRLSKELGGRPRAVLEQVDALVESGWLIRAQHGGMRAGRPLDDLRSAELPLPRSEQDRELAQAQELDPDVRRVLEALVVLAVAADLATVVATADMDHNLVERSLRQLVSENMAQVAEVGVHASWALHSERPRALLYSMIESSQRDALHRRAAAIIRSRARRRLAEIAPLVAHHLLAAGEPAEAYPLLVQASRRALRANQPERAATLQRQAMQVRSAAEPGLDRAVASKLGRELATLQAELAVRRGDLHSAVDAWRVVLDAARADDDASLQVQARAGLGLALTARGAHADAQPHLEAALRKLGQGEPTWPSVAGALAEVRLAARDGAGAEALWARLDQMAQETGVARLSLEASVGRAQGALCQGKLVEALQLLGEAEPRLRHPNAVGLLLRVLMGLTDLALAEGRLLSAVEHALEAERLSRDPARPEVALMALGLAAMAHDARGEVASSRDLARQAFSRLASPTQPVEGSALLARVAVVRAMLAVGDGPRADGLLDELPDAPVGLVDPVGQALAVRARLVATANPALSVESAWAALGREPPLVPTAAARIAVDAALALHAVGDAATVDAVAEALDRTRSPALALLRLEALRVGRSLGVIPAEHHQQAVSQVERSAGSPPGFRARWR